MCEKKSFIVEIFHQSLYNRTMLLRAIPWWVLEFGLTINNYLFNVQIFPLKFIQVNVISFSYGFKFSTNNFLLYIIMSRHTTTKFWLWGRDLSFWDTNTRYSVINIYQESIFSLHSLCILWLESKVVKINSSVVLFSRKCYVQIMIYYTSQSSIC